MNNFLKQHETEINRLFRFAFSSGTSFVLDIALFQLLVMALKGRANVYIFLATVIARVCSSVYNYLLNKKFVFHNTAGIGKSVMKYYGLCICQMLASAGGVTVLVKCVAIPESLSKILVDGCLCVVSFFIQREFVFKKDR